VLEMEGEGAMFMSPELRPLFMKEQRFQIGDKDGTTEGRSPNGIGKIS
jgi:hypothetical protein